MCIKKEIEEKLKDQQNIAVNVDGWTDNQGHSVYTCNIVFADRTIAQWACEDLSADQHTGEYLRVNLHKLHVLRQVPHLMHRHWYRVRLQFD